MFRLYMHALRFTRLQRQTNRLPKANHAPKNSRVLLLPTHPRTSTAPLVFQPPHTTPLRTSTPQPVRAAVDPTRKQRVQHTARSRHGTSPFRHTRRHLSTIVDASTLYRHAQHCASIKAEGDRSAEQDAGAGAGEGAVEGSSSAPSAAGQDTTILFADALQCLEHLKYLFPPGSAPIS